MKKAVVKFLDGKENKGTVINLIECDDHGLQGLQVPLVQCIWDCSNYQVAIGDYFKDGIFYHESKPVQYLPTVEQRLMETEAQLASLQRMMATK